MAICSPEHFEHVVDKALEFIGLEPDPQNRTFEYNRLFRMVGQDITGMTDVRVVRSRYNTAPFGNHDLEHYHESGAPHYFRGLLFESNGTIGLEVNSQFSEDLTDFHVLDVSTISSPEAVNEAQKTLGRTPGSDAFRLVRHPEIGSFTGGQWVHGFANLQVPVAGLEHWDMAMHDLEPAMHVQSWITTPPKLCQQIGARAARILEVHGDRAMLEVGCPSDVTSFASCIDSLAFFTEPLLQTVAKIGYGQYVESSAVKGLIDEYLEDCLPEWAAHFTPLGMVPQGNMMVGSKRRQAAESIVGSYLAHVAQLLINLEEVRPLPDEGRSRSNRIDLLSKVARNELAVAA